MSAICIAGWQAPEGRSASLLAALDDTSKYGRRRRPSPVSALPSFTGFLTVASVCSDLAPELIRLSGRVRQILPSHRHG